MTDSQPVKKRRQNENVTIGNYHLDETELAMAESITKNTLQTQMTQHGLGTGIYGFVDYSENNNGTAIYKTGNYVLSLFELSNPVILHKKYMLDGEEHSDLGNFTWLSTNLNIVCYELYMNKKEINKDNIIEIFSKNYFFPNQYDFYEGVPNCLVSIDDILQTVILFLNDYNYLMSLDINDEFYVCMPINYLLHFYNFDGVINKCDDSGRTGSVKYFFNNEYNSRGYRFKFKKRVPLVGSLIFLHE